MAWHLLLLPLELRAVLSRDLALHSLQQSRTHSAVPHTHQYMHMLISQ